MAPKGKNGKRPASELPVASSPPSGPPSTPAHDDGPDFPPDDAPRHSRGSPPDTGGLLMSQQTQGIWNGAKELITGSIHPEEYLPRTRLTDQEIARDARVMAVVNLVQYGHTNLPHVMWWRYQAYIGRNGEGRKEVVEVLTAQARSFAMRRADLVERARGLNRQQEMG